MPSAAPTYARMMRLIWIDSILQTGASLQPKHVADAFKIKFGQARGDLEAFARLYPARIRLNERAKVYQRVDHSIPVFDRTTTRMVVDARSYIAAAHAATAEAVAGGAG